LPVRVRRGARFGHVLHSRTWPFYLGDPICAHRSVALVSKSRRKTVALLTCQIWAGQKRDELPEISDRDLLFGPRWSYYPRYSGAYLLVEGSVNGQQISSLRSRSS